MGRRQAPVFDQGPLYSELVARIGRRGITPGEFRMRVSDRDLASGLWNRYLPLYVERRELIAGPEGMAADDLEEGTAARSTGVNTRALESTR